MTRGYFLTGNECPLYSALAAEIEKRVEQFACAAIINPAAVKTEEPDSSKRIPLSWNPGSPISNRTLMLSAENRLGQINDALLVCAPPAIYKPAEALIPAEIETMINTHIKGWFYIVRELAIYLRARGSGTLTFVMPEPGPAGGESVSDLFGAPAAASFRALAREMLLSAAVEPFQIMAFSNQEAGREKEFAAWMFKIHDEGSKKNSGKWHKYAKFPLFKKSE